MRTARWEAALLDFIYYYFLSLVCSGGPKSLIQNSLLHQMLILNRILIRWHQKFKPFHWHILLLKYLTRWPTQVFASILALTDSDGEREMGKEDQRKETAHRGTLSGRKHRKAHAA